MAFLSYTGTNPPPSTQGQRLFGYTNANQASTTNPLSTALSRQVFDSLWREGMAPGGAMKPAPVRAVTNYTTADPNDYGRTPAMVSTGTNAPSQASSNGSAANSGGYSSSSSSSSSTSSTSRPASSSSSTLPALNTLGVPDDPRINSIIGRIDSFANLDPNSINARVAALMSPQEAMAQRQINSGVTNALSAQGVLPTGGLAEKMRADISAPIYERLALARNDAMDRYTNQGIDASRGLLSSLVALQEAQRNQRLAEADLGIRREDLGLRRDEAQRQAARDTLQNQSLQQQMELARLQLQQAQNPYRPDQVNYLNASQPGGLQSGSGIGGGGGQTIGGMAVTGPTSSSRIVNQNDARAAAAYPSTPASTSRVVGFSPSDPFLGQGTNAGMPTAGQILSTAGGSGILVGSVPGPTASQVAAINRGMFSNADRLTQSDLNNLTLSEGGMLSNPTGPRWWE